MFSGEVVDVATFPTESGRSLFSDYQVRTTDVYRAAPSVPLKIGAEVVVTRPGGKLIVDGTVVEASIKAFRPLRVGATYMFFVEFLPQSQAFYTRLSRGVLERKGPAAFVGPIDTTDTDIARAGVSDTAVKDWLRGFECR